MMRAQGSMFRSLVVGAVVTGAMVWAGCGQQQKSAETPPPGGESPAASQQAPAPAPAAAPGPHGSAAISGTITYVGQVPNLKPIDMSADPTCAAKHDKPVPPPILVLGEGKTLANVLVHVTGGLPAGATYPAPSSPAEIDQDGCMYQPHVLGMMAGQELKFHNNDGILHNVHGLPDQNREFNLGMPATLKEKETELDNPEGPFRVKCDVHPWMLAYVAVLQNPFFAVTDKDGKFTLDGLPAGTYQIEAWHEKLGTQQATVTVADGQTASQDFQFSPPQG